LTEVITEEMERHYRSKFRHGHKYRPREEVEARILAACQNEWLNVGEIMLRTRTGHESVRTSVDKLVSQGRLLSWQTKGRFNERLQLRYRTVQVN
jgi:hypothetical protein